MKCVPVFIKDFGLSSAAMHAKSDSFPGVSYHILLSAYLRQTNNLVNMLFGTKCGQVLTRASRLDTDGTLLEDGNRKSFDVIPTH